MSAESNDIHFSLTNRQVFEMSQTESSTIREAFPFQGLRTSLKCCETFTS